MKTFTATPCITEGETFEVSAAFVREIPVENKLLLKINDSPPTWVCASVNRDVINDTPPEDVHDCIDSKTQTCNDCVDRHH